VTHISDAIEVEHWRLGYTETVLNSSKTSDVQATSLVNPDLSVGGGSTPTQSLKRVFSRFFHDLFSIQITTSLTYSLVCRIVPSVGRGGWVGAGVGARRLNPTDRIDSGIHVPIANTILPFLSCSLYCHTAALNFAI
jgi:hypothetical protein